MAFIQLAISLVVLGILYTKMLRREIPNPVSKAQAVVPVLLGAASVYLSFMLFLAIASGLTTIGADPSSFPAVPRSLYSAFCTAGFPEELARMLMILLALFIFRRSVKNAYEIILIGAGAGFGFTLFEEFLYGADSILIMVMRIATLAGHMAFGMIMSGYLARARSNKSKGVGPVLGNYIKALLIPVCIHTLYDAFTASNRLLSSADETTAMIGICLSIVSLVALFILQVRVLAHFGKNTERYCNMAV